MKRRIPGALGIMMSLIPSALLSQNLPPVAVDDTVYMCGTTVTIYVQQNDTNPDGDSLTLSIYAGSINGSFSVNGNAIDYTPNVGYTGTDTLVYSLCDDGFPPLCDTAVVIIHIGADFFNNASAQICSGDSIFLGGAWQTAAGSYTDWYTTQYGCDSIIITQLSINPNPVVNISVTGSLNFCTGDSVILTAYGATSWLWSTGATSQNITVFNSGTYSVISSDTNGCSSLATSVNVNAVPPPNATVTPSGPVSICSGDSVTLTASNGTSWQWSTGETSQSIIVGDAGNYWVIVSNGMCTDTSALVNVIVNPLPVATISANGPTTFCQGGSVTLTASNGASWLWSTGVTTQSINAVASGNYWVIVSNGSCSDTSASISVIVNPLPSAVIVANGPTTICEGGTVMLTASNGSSWIWSTGESTQYILVTDAGTYYCSVTDGNGCSAISAGTSIIVNTAPVAGISANGSTDLCLGESVTLSATSGTSWWWSNGATTQSITVNTAGSYYVVCSGDCGSDTSSAVAVNVTNGAPVAGITAAEDGYTYTFTDNSTGASSWLWTFGDNTSSTEQNPVHTYGSYGDYSVVQIVTNACGSDTTSMMISISNPEHLSIYNAFSPNGDGHNDIWNIPLLNYNSQNTVTIVNRWGSEVWKGTNYDNDRVVFNGNNLSGEALPDGTYYYIITLGDKDPQEIRGWVFIKR